MMQINAGDYYQRAPPPPPPKCCSSRVTSSVQQVTTVPAAGTTATTMTPGANSDRSLMRISTTSIRGAELLCCCCSCSTTTSAKSPGLVASLGVCLLVFGYTLLGAFAFMALEGGFTKGGTFYQQETSNQISVSSSSSGAAPSAAAAGTNAGEKKTELFAGSASGVVVTGGTDDGVITLINGNSNNNNNINGSISPTSFSSSETTFAAAPHPPNLLHHDDILGVEDSSTKQLRAYTVERLWSITEDLNVLYKENWTRLAEREVLDFQEKMAQHSLDRASRSGSTIFGTTAVQRGGIATTGSATSIRRNNKNNKNSNDNNNNNENKRSMKEGSSRRWTFGSSFLYSLTLITTIGYGSTSPRTVWGRLITIVYALAGIPLMLVYLSTVGDVLARTFRRLYARACGRVECTKIGDRNRVTRGCQSPSASSSPSSTSSPPQLPLPSSVPIHVPGIIGKSSHHRYDNHIETKLMTATAAATTGHQFYSNKSSSSDDLGRLRTTGSGILLDCSAGDAGTLETGSAGSCAFQESNGSKRQHHHHFYPCSSQRQLCTSSVLDGTTTGTETVCLVRIPISLCLVIILLYICCGALMFNRLEGWSLLEGSYFCFTSLGTIGFGDLVPSGGNASTHILEELCLCACSIYILAGMGLVAMCFNLMQEEVVRVVRVFGRTCTSNGAGMPTIAGNNCMQSGSRVRMTNVTGPLDYSRTSAATASSGIKSDLSIEGYDRCDEHEAESIAMSLVSTS